MIYINLNIDKNTITNYANYVKHFLLIDKPGLKNNKNTSFQMIMNTSAVPP